MEGRGPMTDGLQFRHEALLYEGTDEFLEGTLPFVRDAVAAEEPILVALDQRKIRLLERELGPERDRVRFADMAAIGRNPARIIPVWRDFVAEHRNGRPMRGIGEPAWRGRSAAELGECDRHESLLNLAFADAVDFTLLCPYDARGLDAETLAAARRNHPVVAEDGELAASAEYLGPGDAVSPFDGPLTQPAVEPDEFEFGGEHLSTVRRFVWAHAAEAGLEPRRQADMAMAVSELSANSILHGGGAGTVRVWREDGAVVCEVAGQGRFEDPLAGRRRPLPTEISGRGLWIVNQLCDLVQIRNRPDGNVVRIRLDLN
jgi:anti-sigma regulatory factor (Ser/Thr protein kinase)